MRMAPPIVLTAEQEKALTKVARSSTTSVSLAHRARIVLLAAAGHDNTRIAEELGVGRVQVGRWRKRYAEGGLSAIAQDLPRGGRKPKVDAAQVVPRTTQTLPAPATHWGPSTPARTHPRCPRKKGPRRHDDARLQAPWHHHAVCRPQCAGRHGHRPVPE